MASPSDDTSIRLGDFGSASSVRDGKLQGMCGTPAYMAPEMWKYEEYGKVRRRVSVPFHSIPPEPVSK